MADVPVTDSIVHPLVAATLNPPIPHAPTPESQLAAIELRPAFIPSLFRLATAAPNSPLSLAAAIYLKNLVRREWQYTTASARPTGNVQVHSSLPPADRDFLRANIVPAMAAVDAKVQAQLSDTLKRIAAADFPLRFPQLQPLIMTALYSNEPAAVEAGLLALRALAKVYEFKGAGMVAGTLDLDEVVTVNGHPHEEDLISDLQFLHDHPRAALNYIVSQTFPRLLHILRGLEDTISKETLDATSVTPKEAVLLSGDMVHLMQKTICKIFWSFTQYDLPLLLINNLEGAFASWMSTFLVILRRPVKPPICAPDTMSLSNDDLAKMPKWKVKQWIVHTIYRLFQRYSNPSRLSQSLVRMLDRETMTRFGDFFRRTFAAPFTETMLDMLRDHRGYISSRVANLALLYLECAVSTGRTYRVVKPRLAQLITNIIFPYLCVSESDLALWAEDPVEYVRKMYDVVEDFQSPRAAACSLLSVLSNSRRSVVNPPLISFLVQIMDTYADSQQYLARVGGNDPEAQKAHRMLAMQKDGALLAFGTIRDTVVSSDPNASFLRAVLSSYAIDEFDSEVPFLRARVCWLYGVLTATENISIDTVLPGLDGVRKCLADKEFPVRVRAAVDIRHFIQNDIASSRIAPKVAELLTFLFTLLDDVDNTDIVATIDQVVVRFSDQIAPFARPLCERLVNTFSRAASAGESDDEAGYAAAQCLQALQSIVCSVAQSTVQNKIVLLAEIEHIIAEIFDHMFQEDRIEHFEGALDLLAMFVYHSAADRGSHLKDCMEAGVEPHEALLSPTSGGSGFTTTEFFKSNSSTSQAMQNDAASGGGVISPYLWSLFPKAMHAFHDWASDYSVHYLHLVNSFLSRASRVFLCSRDGEQTYVQLLLGMISRFWDDSCLDEDEFAIQGSRVCGLFLRYCRDIDGISIDREVGVLTELVVLRLRSNSRSLRAVNSLLTSLAHLTFVSPMTALAVIDKAVGCTEEVFSLWTSMAKQNQIERDYDRRTSAIALSAVLGSDWNQLPPVLRQSIPQILLTVVQLLESLAKPTSLRRHRIIIEGNNPGVYGPVNVMGMCNDRSSSSSDENANLSTGSLVTTGGNLALPNEIKNGENSSQPYTDKMGGDEDIEGDFSNEVRYLDSHDEDYAEDCEVEEDGENSMFHVLQDVDELLFFEKILSQLSPVASQQLMKALASDDTQRIQCTLHRAAEQRTIMVNDVAKV